MTSTDGERYRPIQAELGFIYTAFVERPANKYIIRNTADKDCIHNHKKLINPTDHESRVLMMNDFMIHLNHLQLVYDGFTPAEN